MKLDVTCKVPEVGVDFLEETENSRKRRKCSLARLYRQDARHAKLDKYFSSNPPNGTPLEIFRGMKLAIRDSKRIDWPACLDSIHRLSSRGILKVTTKEGRFRVVTYTSTSCIEPFRAKQDPELAARIEQFKREIAPTPFYTDPLPLHLVTVHGCKMVEFNHWQVRSFLVGRQRSLGTYPYLAAIRLADAITYYFSSRRRGPHRYNTSEAAARQSIADYPALETFLTGLDFLLF